jgi:hypothetical protein
LKRAESREAADSVLFGDDPLNFLPQVDLDLSDSKYLNLLLHALSRIPPGTPPIRSLTKVRLRKRGSLEGLVGLTRFMMADYKVRGEADVESLGRHIVTFYTGLLSRLSDPSVVAIIAHELAHAWLNEHVRPEESRKREREADILAEMWGFGEELAALASETEPVNG